MNNTQKRNQNQDERILAAIIAGSEASGRLLRPATQCKTRVCETYTNGYGQYSVFGPACAIGAGILGLGVDLLWTPDPKTTFSKLFNVNRSYAEGLNDGFEGVEYRFNDGGLYARGYAVGVAAFYSSKVR